MRIFLYILLFLSTSSILSQDLFDNELPIRGKVYYNWHFGYGGAGITFDTPDKEPIFLESNENGGGGENCSTISDREGNYLMHLTGDALLDNEYNIIDERFAIPASKNNSQVIVPLKNDRIMVINPKFSYRHSEVINGKNIKWHDSTGLEYCIIKYYPETNELNIEKPWTDLNPEFRNESIAINYSYKSNTYILVAHDHRGITYLYEIDLEGKILSQNSQSTFPVTYRSGGDIKLNMSCDKLAIQSSNGMTESKESDKPKLFLFHLSPEELELNFFKSIELDEYSILSFEFSSNSKFIYVNTVDQYYIEDPNRPREKIIQYDIYNDDINTIYKDFVPQSSEYDGFTPPNNIANIADLQIGPNKKIYSARVRGNHLSSLETPDFGSGGYKFKPIVFPEYDGLKPYCFIALPQMMSASFADVFVSSEIIACEGENIQLDSKLMYPDSNAVFNWTGPNGFKSNERQPIIENINLSQEGIYKLTVNSNNEIFTNQTYVRVRPAPEVEIDALPELIVCDEDEITLRARSEDITNYLWTTGDTTQSIIITESGTYGVTVTDSNGCTAYTEVDAGFAKDSPFEIVGPDGFCPGEEITLSAGSDFEEYLWSTGETTKTITVNTAGEYSLTVVTENGCELTDEIEVIEYSTPDVTLKQVPTTICEGDTVTLELERKNDNYNYLWSTGETTESIEVYEADTYKLIVTDTITGCIDSTEIVINIDSNIEPVINGTNICGNNPTQLKAEPSGTDYEYLWSTGETTQSIEVNQPGTYSVTVTKGNCTGFSEREIEQYPEPEITIEGNTSICVAETTTLSSSQDFAEYLWSTGDITKEIIVDEAGTYSLTVTDENGCTATEEVNVEVNEVDYDLSANSVDYGKTYITETKSETITLTNTSGNEIVIDGITIPANGDYEIIHTLNPERTGPYTETITVEITEPCAETITINITAEIYARVTVRAPEIETQVGAINVPLPITMSAEADLYEKEYDYTVQTVVNNEIYYTEENLTFNNTSTIESNETEIVSYSGTVLLARQLEYPITFGEVSFSDPYIEIETIDGQITVDRICVHGTRNVLHSFTDITVNPNPAKDNINIGITTQEEGNVSVELISATGASVYRNNITHSSGTDNIQIQTDDIPSGMYQIIIKTKGHIYRKEIVVAR